MSGEVNRKVQDVHPTEEPSDKCQHDDQAVSAEQEKMPVVRSSEKPDRVKYVLYVHYAFSEEADFKAYNEGTPPENLRCVHHLMNHIRGLKELLTSPGHEGQLVLFYAPGYERFLKFLAERQDIERLRQDIDHINLDQYEDPNGVRQLRFAKAVGEYVQRELRKWNIAERVRFVTSFDLGVILGRANTVFAADFPVYFIGRAAGVRYDATKLVEAILRLRLLGNGVPVFRLDHDVIFRDSNKDIGDLGLFKAVATALHAYKLRLDQTTVSTFVFSASYNDMALLYPPPDKGFFERWSEAFATRIYPALVANKERLLHICAMPENSDAEKKHKKEAWDNYVEVNLKEDFALKYYGIKKVGTEKVPELKSDGISGLVRIGAHPLYAVISGALLCLSEGAILDLPPFSNLRMNVMWIDDHLKFSLHRAMNHFTSGEMLELPEPGLSYARMSNIMVTKARPPVNNLPWYIFQNYLPTLLWGTIMDAWITNDPILRCRFETLNSEEKALWLRARETQSNAPLPKAMLKILREGVFTGQDETELQRALRTSSIVRINEVRKLWAELVKDGQETFASYWAKGEVEKVFGRDYFEREFERERDREEKLGRTVVQTELWRGIAPNLQPDQSIQRIEQLGDIGFKINELILDTIGYVHWTLQWPRFVQIVRSIRQGDFIGDLNWHPDKKAS
ncbi:MAG TPA: hypothetical protein VKU00_06920 [Chthonomonadaceae bacterium]|nr:hypothetical protein [Chthonomonadaceae bacterium]